MPDKPRKGQGGERGERGGRIEGANRGAKLARQRHGSGEVSRSRILVVDDQEMEKNAIRSFVGDDHDVVVVSRAQEALGRIQGGERFDLIICDLPEMTGVALFELCTLVTEHADRMLFMIGGMVSADAATFLDARRERVIEKPFDKASLMTAILARLKAQRL